MNLKIGIKIIKKSLIPAAIALLIILLYVWYVMRIKFLLPETWNKPIGQVVFILGLIIVVYWLQGVLTVFFDWYRENMVKKTRTKLDEIFLPLFVKTANVFLWLIALIILLSNLGINVNALLATLGVGSLAIALAAQDTIANLIAGFLIMVDRPFIIGDKIKLPTGEKVEVLDIGVRRSRFLAEDKAIVIVPNVDLSKNKIVNYTYHQEEE